MNDPSGPDDPYVVISIHDVAPASFEPSRRLVELVEAIGARASLLVIPGRWRGRDLRGSADFVSWLRDAEVAGHEVVVHGWEHVAVRDHRTTVRAGRRAVNRVRTRGCAEFSSLGAEEARRRAGDALRTLVDVGTEPVGFTPPGWLASAAAMWMLRDLGFDYTTSRNAIHDLSDGRRIDVPAYCQRAASPLARPGATAVERIVRSRLGGRRPVRIALHVDDLAHPRLARSAETLLAAVAASEVVPVVYRDVVRSTRIAVGVGGR